jgi:zinc transport system ATP-binding protein
MQLIKAMEKDAVIELKGVSYGFGGALVLSGISFSVEKGDFMGLIGPNGSGKTTLLKLILGLYPLRTGSIKLFGTDISSFQEWSRIGYVPQKATSNTDLIFPATVKEVVSMGLLSGKRFPKVIGPKDDQLIIDALKTVGMEKLRDRRIGELSGGQQQRVFIARALISNPDVLFLDEPTTGIDQATQESFYELLGQLNKRGITIILISHDIGKITRYVTKVASLNRVLEFYGNHKEFCEYDPGHCHIETDQHKLCLDRG